MDRTKGIRSVRDNPKVGWISENVGFKEGMNERVGT